MEQYGAAAIAKARQLYQDHLARGLQLPARALRDDLESPQLQAIAEAVIWATDLDMSAETWMRNEQTFQQLFERIGAPEVYEELSRADCRRICTRQMNEDEELRDWLLSPEAPDSILKFYLNHT